MAEAVSWPRGARPPSYPRSNAFFELTMIDRFAIFLNLVVLDLCGGEDFRSIEQILKKSNPASEQRSFR